MFLGTWRKLIEIGFTCTQKKFPGETIDNQDVKIQITSRHDQT